MAKRRRSFCILHSAFCIVLVAAAAHGAATATSQAFAVDSRDGELRALAPGDIGYSPSWCGVTEPGSYVVIEKIEHAGMSNAATSSVTNAPGTEGSYQFSPAVGGERCFRLVHRVYDANDAEIGTALVRDIAFGFASAPGEATIADGHGDLLQREAALGKVVGLTYDTSWATNADTIAISAIQLKDGRGRDLATPVTNALFSAHGHVEYIQGNGSSSRIVIDDYTPNPNDDKIEAIVSFPSGTLNQTQTIWCSRGATTSTATWTLFVLNSSGYKFRLDYGSTSGTAVTPALSDTDEKYTVTADGNVFTWSGGNGQTHTRIADFTAGGPLMLFASYYNGAGNNLANYGKYKLYSLKVWRSGALIHDFVPAIRHSNSQPGLYDCAQGGKFYPGTGSFTTGDFVSTSAGTFYKTLKSGGWRFLHTSFDKDGNIICAPYFADYFLKTKGTAVMLQ